jgi:hypothetical protein
MSKKQWTASELRKLPPAQRLHNFFHLYCSLVNTWQVGDNMQEGVPRLIAHGDNKEGATILVEETWQQMLRAQST